ncbi:MAG: sugar ABC transporter substrate-binding protein, partial [Rhodobacter sp.]|nr:sugar ABC transporter substrate-binding protein [Rhodobacter sp.]
GCTLKEDGPWKSNALTNRFVDSGTVFVDQATAPTYVNAMVGITADLLAGFEKDFLTCS